jgi:HEAT repeat protein
MTDDKYGQGRALDLLSARGLAAKREYVRGLEDRGDAEALALLAECLCDESWFLRDLAESAFLRMADRGASVLLPLLDQGLWFTRTSAARVLGRLGWRPAVPGLLRLAEDANETAVGAARDALIAIGRQGGAFRLAHALHRLPPDVRRRRLDEIGERDRAMLERLERMMGHDDLMAVNDPEALADDSPVVRSSEEGVEWELLTGPPPRRDPASGAGGGNAGSSAGPA